jgi:hypothetical protein
VEGSTDPGDELDAKIANVLMWVSIAIGTTGVFTALANAIR